MTRLLSTILTLSLCVVPLSAAPLFAQNQADQTSPPPVSMAVTVADKHANFVPNLTKDDFTLTDDGHPQAITYFAPAANLPLTVGLLVQTSAGQSATLDAQRAEAQKFLDQMLTGANHRAFVIQFAGEVDLLADVSADQTKLNKAVGQLGTPQFHNTAADAAGGGGPRLEGGSEGTTLYDSIYLASTELMKKQPIRKVLVILTDGLDRGSKESLFSTIEAAQRANTAVYALYFQGQEQHKNYAGAPGQRRGRVGGGWPGSGYPGGYPGSGGGWPGGGGGGHPSRPTEGSHMNGAKILEQICRETGGHMYEVDRKHPIQQAFSTIATQLRAQYVLGFTPGKQSDGYHKLAITPKNKDLFVETREGYYTGD